VKVAVVGLGTIAPYFISAVDRDPSWKLTGVCDRVAAKLRPYRAAGVTAFTDVAELLDAAVAEALVVTLPNRLHFPVVADALRHGLHVCCEKPLTIDPAEATELAGLARERGRVLMTAFHRRYNRNVRALAASLPPATEIAEVTCRYAENIHDHLGGDGWYLDPAQCGGGCLIDNGPNAIDVVRLLLGELTVVDARVEDLRDGLEFRAEVALRAASGVPARVELDWGWPDGERKDVTVRLRDGSLRHADMLAGYEGFKASLDHEYVGVLAAFGTAVATGEPPPEDGTAVTRLVHEAYEMARGNGSPDHTGRGR
jgi:L-arabinose 1-dehydrogenase